MRLSKGQYSALMELHCNDQDAFEELIELALFLKDIRQQDPKRFDNVYKLIKWLVHDRAQGVQALEDFNSGIFTEQELYRRAKEGLRSSLS